MALGFGALWLLASAACVVHGRRLAGPHVLGRLGSPVPFTLASVGLSPVGVLLAWWLVWKRELVPEGVLTACLSCLAAVFTTLAMVLAAFVAR